MKKNPCFLIVTLSVLLFSNSCKKEKVSKNEFDIFVGNWSCTNYFESSYGRNSPTIGYSYTFSNGQLIYNSKYPDSTGNFIYNTDNFEFKSEITTQLVNSSTLIIHERYTGVNNNGVVKVFEYNNTIELTMNQEKYGNIENSITISPDKISFSSINHDSYTSINNSRVLIKIK